MPTVCRVNGFRFFFFSNEGNEPPHIHVERGDCDAKFWLEPVKLARCSRFWFSERAKLRKLVERNQRFFLEKWHEYFRQ